MSATCGTCAHWTHPRVNYAEAVRTPHDRDARPFEERHQEQVAADRQYGSCALIGMPPEWDGPIANLPLAVAVDGSEYHAELLTLPTFACALHEPAPRPSP